VAERPVLEAVVFDAGGTLLRLDFEWMSGAVRALGHVVSAEALRRAEVSARKAFEEVFDEPPPAAVAGEPRLGEHGDTRLYFRVILEAAGVPLALVGPALERCFERQAGPGLWSRPAEGARGCLDALALLGLRLACVSNSDGAPKSSWPPATCVGGSSSSWTRTTWASPSPKPASSAWR